MLRVAVRWGISSVLSQHQASVSPPGNRQLWEEEAGAGVEVEDSFTLLTPITEEEDDVVSPAMLPAVSSVRLLLVSNRPAME